MTRRPRAPSPPRCAQVRVPPGGLAVPRQHDVVVRPPADRDRRALVLECDDSLASPPSWKTTNALPRCSARIRSASSASARDRSPLSARPIPSLSVRSRRAGVIVREQRNGSLEQADRRANVAPREGAGTGRAEVAGSASGQLALALVESRQLGAGCGRQRSRWCPRISWYSLARSPASLLQPVRVALVEIGALRLEDAPVGHVAQEDVLEAEGPSAARSARRPAR